MDLGRIARGSACAGVLALALLVPSSALADWVESPAAPLNAAGTSVATAPSAADVGGAPWAVLDEAGGLVVEQDTGAGWQQVGGPLPSGTLDSAPQIADIGGTVYVTWSQQTGNGGISYVYVYYLSNGQWAQAGAPFSNASAPSITSVNGAPYIAVSQGSAVALYDYDGHTWGPVGMPFTTGTDVVDSTSLAALSGRAYVAWSQYDPNNPTGSDEVSADGFNAGWGTALPLVTGGFPSLASGASGLYLAYAVNGGIQVDTTTGDGWSSAGTVNVSSQLPVFPSLADINNTPYLAFVQSPPNSLYANAIVEQLSGGAWTQVGSPIPNTQTDVPFDVAITGVGGTPFVSWIAAQCPASAAGTDAFAATLTAGPTNTVQTSCPGFPMVPPQSFPAATQGVPYSIRLTVAGGKPPYTWVASGLPPGLAIDPGSGTISGTPTAAGQYKAQFAVTDANGYTVGGTLTLQINPAPSLGGSTSTGTGTTSTSSSNSTSPPAAKPAPLPPFAGAALASTSLQANATSVAVTLTCPANTPGGRCQQLAVLYSASGTLPAKIATIAKAKPKKKPKRPPAAQRLGGKSFSVAAGKKATTSIALSKQAQTQLRAHKQLSARLVLVSSDTVGQTATKTTKVTIKLTQPARKPAPKRKR
jgi:hypothetical protein